MHPIRRLKYWLALIGWSHVDLPSRYDDIRTEGEKRSQSIRQTISYIVRSRIHKAEKPKPEDYGL